MFSLYAQRSRQLRLEKEIINIGVIPSPSHAVSRWVMERHAASIRSGVTFAPPPVAARHIYGFEDRILLMSWKILLPPCKAIYERRCHVFIFPTNNKQTDTRKVQNNEVVLAGYFTFYHQKYL